MRATLNDVLGNVKAGTLPLKVCRTLALDQIVDAHRTMARNAAGGKIVVLT